MRPESAGQHPFHCKSEQGQPFFLGKPVDILYSRMTTQFGAPPSLLFYREFSRLMPPFFALRSLVAPDISSHQVCPTVRLFAYGPTAVGYTLPFGVHDAPILQGCPAHFNPLTTIHVGSHCITTAASPLPAVRHVHSTFRSIAPTAIAAFLDTVQVPRAQCRCL